MSGQRSIFLWLYTPEQRGISVECQPPPFRQSVLQSEKVWMCLGGGGWGGGLYSEVQVEQVEHVCRVLCSEVQVEHYWTCRGRGTVRKPHTDGGISRPGPGSRTGIPHLPEQNNRYDWKNYLPATWLARGNNESALGLFDGRSCTCSFHFCMRFLSPEIVLSLLNILSLNIVSKSVSHTREFTYPSYANPKLKMQTWRVR